MYFVIISFIVSAVIFAIAKFIDQGNKKLEEPFIDESTLPMGEINIELFNVNKKEDLEELTLSLGKSFYDDPFYSWLFTNEKTKLQGIGWLKIRMVAMNFPFSNTLIATMKVNGKRKIIGVSAWVPAGHSTGTADHIRAGILKIPFLWGFDIFFKILAMADVSGKGKKDVIKNGEFWMLDHLHVDPAFQGKGVSRLLLEPGLKTIDSQRMNCMLNAANPKNLTLYQKFGFKVEKEFINALPSYPLAPPFWIMTRKAKS